MNITLTLDTEQQGALDDLLAAYNATRDTPVTAEAYLQTVLLGIVNDKVAKNVEAVASQLVAGAKMLPFAKRQELIADVRAKLTE